MTIFKFNKWRFSINFYNPKLRGDWLHHFGVRIRVLDFYITDLDGEIIFCNVVFSWEKLFK